ncbi:hypothetical protein Q9L58_001663 [Maublancomyces gigas]|uniref:Uncharacterized protein n=1 Tax=Discina gigas TaxID=1032678 RepID=A0ABR3GTG4_9PEZI
MPLELLSPRHLPFFKLSSTPYSKPMQEDMECNCKGNKRTWGELEEGADDLGSSNGDIGDGVEQPLEPAAKVAKYTLPSSSPSQPVSISEGVQELAVVPGPLLSPDEEEREEETPILLPSSSRSPIPFDRESLGWERSDLGMFARLKEVILLGPGTLEPNPFHPANRRRRDSPPAAPPMWICFIMRSHADPTGARSPRLKVDELAKVSDIFEWYFQRAYPGVPILPLEAYDDQETGDSYYLAEVEFSTGTLGTRYGYKYATRVGLRMIDTLWWEKELRVVNGQIWLVGCDRVRSITAGRAARSIQLCNDWLRGIIID